MCNSCLSRRLVLQSLVTTSAGAAVAACTVNPVTGRRQLDIVSDAELEVAAGQAWDQLLAEIPQSSSASLTSRVRTVGTRVAAFSGYDANWEFALFDRPEPNAFVLPGGKVGVFEGLFQAARNNDQLAAVLGHEVGHVLARHAAERVSQNVAVGLGAEVVGAVVTGQTGNSQTGALARDVFGTGATLGVLLPYSRTQEIEADQIGVQLMHAANYDPYEAIALWDNMIELGAGGQPEFLSTHPNPERRIQVIQDTIDSLGA